MHPSDTCTSHRVAALTNHPAFNSVSPQQNSWRGGNLGPRPASDETARRPSRWTPSDSKLRFMEQNGAGNGQDAQAQASQTAGTGVTKGPSPRKRRKVNHGKSTVPAPFVCIPQGSLADHRTCSCSVCILSTICKLPIGLLYTRGCSGRMRLCEMFDMS